MKPQSAFFEAHGADGVRAFARGLRVRARRRPARDRRREARRHRLDRARVSREAFIPLADAVTVNPYLGGDSRRAVSRGVPARRRRDLLPREDVEPGQRRRAGRRARGRAHALAARRAARRASWGEELVGERGLSAVGAVVGATLPARGRRGARAAAAARCSCCPGIGAQGGDAGRRRRAPSRAARPSALVSASRSVIYAYARSGRRLALGRGCRGRAPRARGLACLRPRKRPRATRAAALRRAGALPRSRSRSPCS